MKSNQERSNGCLPPKKREILAMEQRPVVVAAAAPLANDSHHTENLAWLASVASERCRSRETGSPRFPVSTSTSSSNTSLSAVPLTSLSTVYPTALTQQGGTIQYAQLAPNVQFISSALTGPYAGYISSQIIPTNATSSPVTTGQRPHLDSYTTALFSQGAKGEQQFQIGLSPDMAVSLPNSTLSQYIQLDSTPLTVTSPTAHLPLQLHTHPGVLPHTLTLAPSQVVLQYAEGSAAKKSEGHIKGLLNGELERGVAKQNNGGKAAPTSQSVNNQQHQVHSYEARHILLPADYSQETSGLQTTSLVLVANPHPQPHHRPNIGAEPDHGPNKFHPSLIHSEKGGGICLGKTVSRTSSFTSLPSSDVLKPPGPHTVIQTSHSSEELPASLYSTTQPPIIGYITSAGHQHAVSYHATLPQHLVIPGGQSLLIPVSGASGTTDLDATRSLTAMTATTSPQLATAMPHAYLTTALSKCEMLGSDGHQSTAIVQAQVLPILPANTATTVVASPSPAPAPAQAPAPAPAPASAPAQASPSPSSSPAVLPPFFMRGSIIQLADGELKRVEDLKTEDFIQSAEISSELKIDSSTVERIDCSPTPNAVVIQFAVGELKAQVCVEVLVEYPFFVFGQGWSSCCPDRTTQLFELSCAKLCVGDVCVSLTLRGLRTGPASGRNGQGLDARLRNSQNNTDMSQKNSQTLLVDPTVRNGQSMNAAGSNTGFLMKTVKTERLEKDRGSRCGDQVKGPGPGLGGPGEAVYVAGSRGTSDMQAVSGNGELMQREQRTDMPPPSTPQLGDTDKPLTGRKRRWSAPERDQTDKANEEPPLTLPKPSFISQEVKISIEGRSNTGS